MDCKVIVLGLITWLILDLTTQAVSLDPLLPPWAHPGLRATGSPWVIQPGSSPRRLGRGRKQAQPWEVSVNYLPLPHPNRPPLKAAPEGVRDKSQ